MIAVHLNAQYVPASKFFFLSFLFFSGDIRVVNAIPVVAEGDQCVTVILVSVFSSLVVLCFCILLFIMRKKIRKRLHYAPPTPTSYPIVPSKF
jgi:hypothetical protein